MGITLFVVLGLIGLINLALSDRRSPPYTVTLKEVQAKKKELYDLRTKPTVKQVHAIADISTITKPKTIPCTLQWFIDPWVARLNISPAEQLIIDQLSRYHITWEREVSFKGLVSDKGAPLRYDFYLIDHGTIIEYNGKQWHSDPAKVATDQLKLQFCQDHNIKVITLDRYHYYHMEYTIAELMNQLGIKVKRKAA